MPEQPLLSLSLSLSLRRVEIARETASGGNYARTWHVPIRRHRSDSTADLKRFNRHPSVWKTRGASSLPRIFEEGRNWAERRNGNRLESAVQRSYEWQGRWTNILLYARCIPTRTKAPCVVTVKNGYLQRRVFSRRGAATIRKFDGMISRRPSIMSGFETRDSFEPNE